VKNVRTQEVVIGGWAEGKGELAGTLGALLLGIPEGKGLTYAGRVGTGFSDQARGALLIDLRALEQDASPFTRALSRTEGALAHYVRPQLVGEVQYAEWTREGHLRHPSWRGLRADKDPSEVAREP
jgi:bifunctional non-homologous end joining protein LigD